jgi:hypothetical protein
MYSDHRSVDEFIINWYFVGSLKVIHQQKPNWLAYHGRRKTLIGEESEIESDHEDRSMCSTSGLGFISTK